MPPCSRGRPVLVSCLLLAGACLGLALPVAAESADEADLVTVEMGATTPEIQPHAQFDLTFRFRVEPHWHIYWKNPGDTGAPTRVAVEGPEGYTIGEVRWPRPLRILEDGFEAFGYEDEVVLFVPVTAPADAAKGAVEFTAKLSWLVCKTYCVMGSRELSLELPLATNDLAAEPTPAAEHVTAFHRRLPAPVPDGGIRFDGKILHLTVPAGADDETIRVVPDARPGVSIGQTVHQQIDGQHELQIYVTLEPENALGEPMVIAGLVLCGDSQDDPHYEFAVPAGK